MRAPSFERDALQTQLTEVHVAMKRKVAEVQQIVVRHERTVEEMMLGMEQKMRAEHELAVGQATTEAASKATREAKAVAQEALAPLLF